MNIQGVATYNVDMGNLLKDILNYDEHTDLVANFVGTSGRETAYIMCLMMILALLILNSKMKIKQQ